MPLGVPGFVFRDLFVPERLRDLHEVFCADLKERALPAYQALEAYRACQGSGMSPEQVSSVLLAVAPHVSAFVGRLFGVERELARLADEVKDRSPLWRFKADFAKKRVLKLDAGKAWKGTISEAIAVATAAVSAMFPHDADAVLRRGTKILPDEELALAKAVVRLVEVDEVARKAAKAGGAQWTDELRARAVALRKALASDWNAQKPSEEACACADPASPTDAENQKVVAFALDAIEAWLAHRRKDHHDPAHRWPSLHLPKTLDYQHLVELKRPEPKLPELFVGPEHERRERDGFALTDRRGDPRMVEQEIDYCLYCHERDKDSCSKGYRDPKTKEIKKNPLGVPLNGCPLDEKISEMHVCRRDGDALGALALVCLDNPMCPGTGHRICNDCMKACVFQKQEPVNIPQIETRVLTEVLSLPFGLEMYGLLTRWNPLNVRRPYPLPYTGKKVLVVGVGPAGYTLAHHLSREGFAVVAIDGLKIEPLPPELVGTDKEHFGPVKDFGALYEELDERTLLGFGGVSEYGITVRWDKNFLTVLYVTLARNRLLRVYGGIRFGGTVTLEDAWRLGFDHVALATGAGRPTIVPMKNNLIRGVRKASDFLMGLQLSGAYKANGLANLQVQLPGIVIGGGLTAIDTATELGAYYIVQVEKTLDRFERLAARSGGEEAVLSRMSPEEVEVIREFLEHGRAVREERARAAGEGRPPDLQGLLRRWGGVSIVYRKRLQDSPAYRLNHEEVTKALEEGIRFVECLSPLEVVPDALGRASAVVFERQEETGGKWRGTGETVTLPARAVMVAAGTHPNSMYEKEHPGTFRRDRWGEFFVAHRVERGPDGARRLVPALAEKGEIGFFTSYEGPGGRLVSFYGDNHPVFEGNVVKAMASAKNGAREVAALFEEEVARLRDEDQPEREERWIRFAEITDDGFRAKVLDVLRLTPTIVEVIVRAPLAARNFRPGQFYKLQNFESYAQEVEGFRLTMEGIALTGAWVDRERGLLSMIALEMGHSSRLCSLLEPGEEVLVMGPTGTPTEIPEGETVCLAGGGLGNAVLFSIAEACKARGNRVIYFAGYKQREDLFKQAEIEKATDLVIWSVDRGEPIEPRRPQDKTFVGNIVQAMDAYARGALGERPIELREVTRIVSIGSDRMMNAVRVARKEALACHLRPDHVAIGSINSPMQCMLKEVCAQCLQKHVDPATGREKEIVFSCFNQDQPLDEVDFEHLRQRLSQNSAAEKLTNLWLDYLFEQRKVASA
jgi:NADPH-dependent glutamate synthase beta subunit-like oxidoreductase/NAD(P)H-flavin reductase